MKRFQPDPSRYEIERNRGEGQSATVCKAIRIDPRENVRQVVALKFPKDGTRIADLRHEFDALSRVGSKHCARALAWESAGSQNVLVLEWIEGPTLFELASAFSIAPEIQHEITAQIYQGLLDLNTVGLHHGDLHPSNIMIGSDGVVRLIDFSSRGTESGLRFGVPAFLAPEVQETGETSFEADLFALGALQLGMEIGFRSLPQVAEVKSSGFCAADPLLREQDFVLKSSEDRQIRLRDLIADFLNSKRFSQTQMLPGPSKKLNSKLALRMVGLVLLSTLSVPVKAEAPLLKSHANAKLSVSTHQWAEISLNGRKIGYSPVEIGALSPGLHRLSWSGAFGAGSLVLELNSGELKQIDERVLRAHSIAVKH